jgi:hypothetical protein
MKLTVLDRLIINQFMPERGGLITMRLVRNMRDRFAFSSEEISELELKDESDGRITWNSKKERESIDFKFTQEEISILKQRVDEVDKEGNITLELLELAIKIKEET